MTASDFPINFPYGATSPPYSPTHPHRGDDRACPTGTPVIINGVTIGLTGATGKVIGAHLHIQEWQGDYSNTRKPQNAFKSGVVVNVDSVGTYPNNKNDGTQGDGSFGKFITIQTADGWNDSYCHLSQINVKIGDTMSKDALTKEEIISIYTGFFDLPDGQTNPDLINAYTGKPLDGLLQQLHADPSYQAHYKAVNNPSTPNAEVLKPNTVYKTP